VLEEEKKKMVSELADLKSQNAASDRAIRQAKTFTSKRDEEHKKMKEESDLLNRTLTELNAEIMARSWKLDQDKRALEDKNLIKRHNDQRMQARQEHNMVNIDINVADSRIKDLLG
jgi:hypothetical protein